MLRKIIAIAAFALIPQLGACDSPTAPHYEPTGCDSFMTVCADLGAPPTAR